MVSITTGQVGQHLAALVIYAEDAWDVWYPAGEVAEQGVHRGRPRTDRPSYRRTDPHGAAEVAYEPLALAVGPCHAAMVAAGRDAVPPLSRFCDMNGPVRRW